jgi:hypothetical protein
MELIQQEVRGCDRNSQQSEWFYDWHKENHVPDKPIFVIYHPGQPLQSHDVI